MKQINRNFPGCEEYDESSFTGKLNEKCRWDDEEYFKLDQELRELGAELSDNAQLDRELAWRVMRIFSYVMMTIGAHYDARDGYVMEGLDDQALTDRRERFQLIVEGFFRGEMPATEDFDYRPE
jgi:hypothetical protein